MTFSLCQGQLRSPVSQADESLIIYLRPLDIMHLGPNGIRFEQECIPAGCVLTAAVATTRWHPPVNRQTLQEDELAYGTADSTNYRLICHSGPNTIMSPQVS